MRRRCEPLHPSEQCEVIDSDVAFGEKLLEVAVEDPHRRDQRTSEQDDLGWESEPGERRHRRSKDSDLSAAAHR